jgi:hypothetical protein
MNNDTRIPLHDLSVVSLDAKPVNIDWQGAQNEDGDGWHYWQSFAYMSPTAAATRTHTPTQTAAGEALVELVRTMATVPVDELDARDWHGVLGVLRSAAYALDERAPMDEGAGQVLLVMIERARKSCLPVRWYAPRRRPANGR